ncbi:RNA transcription, translation and transport factor protein [Rhynchophorus ferrugineus]|uniref:RNA transcription, translation and transport factor protein n=1 Tax=Rhynchophorus ferrugineus TaxID=354439 RepID=UPI003FCD3381
MSKRLLSALEYPNADNVNLSEEKTIRSIVVWLELNKINGAKTSTLNGLKDVGSKDWVVHFDAYKDQLGCPPLESQQEEIHWLLGKAIHLETSKNKNVYLQHAVENIRVSSAPKVIAENPLDKLDFRSKEFQDRINQLAKTLKIVPYPDPLVTLQAVRKIVCTRLAPDCVEHPDKYIAKGTPFPFQDADLGFDLNDPVLNKAAKILRMLYIQDLRNLQTKANELIVGVQSVTANPKTDTKLGQVGR